MGPGGQGQGMMNMAPGGISGMVGVNVNPEQMNSEIMQIPQNTLNDLKLELGYGDKELSNLSMMEKVCVPSFVLFLPCNSLHLRFFLRRSRFNDRYFIIFFLPLFRSHSIMSFLFGSAIPY